MKCVNLKEQFGRKFKIDWDECRQSPSMDPWLMQIPGKYGHVIPHGDNELAVSVDGHAGIAGRIRRLPCCRVHQDGDFGELTAIFDVVDFDQVAEIIQPKRRRVVSEAERQRLRVMGYKSRFTTHCEGQSTERQCVQTGSGDPEAVQEQTDAKLASRSGLIGDVNLGSLPAGEVPVP